MRAKRSPMGRIMIHLAGERRRADALVGARGPRGGRLGFGFFGGIGRDGPAPLLGAVEGDTLPIARAIDVDA